MLTTSSNVALLTNLAKNSPKILFCFVIVPFAFTLDFFEVIIK